MTNQQFPFLAVSLNEPQMASIKPSLKYVSAIPRHGAHWSTSSGRQIGKKDFWREIRVYWIFFFFASADTKQMEKGL